MILYSAKQLRELYPGITEEEKKFNNVTNGTQGGLVSRELGIKDFQYCSNWLFDHINPHTDTGFIEIGSAWGASFHIWSSIFVNGPKISIDCLDTINYPWFTPEHFVSRNNNWKSRFTDVHAVYGSSQSTHVHNTVTQLLSGSPVHWLFIDGDHSPDAVRSDFERYRQFVRPGGFIGFHDTADGYGTHLNSTSIGYKDATNIGQIYNTLDNRVWSVANFDGIGIIQCT